MSKKTKKRARRLAAQSIAAQTVSSVEVANMTKQVDNLPTAYFNHARVAAGYLDVRVFFGEQTVSPTGQVSFTESLCVAMTPEFAHLFLLLLTQQMSAFEKLYGAFRPVPQNTEAFRKIAENIQKQVAFNPIKQ